MRNQSDAYVRRRTGVRKRSLLVNSIGDISRGVRQSFRDSKQRRGLRARQRQAGCRAPRRGDLEDFAQKDSRARPRPSVVDVPRPRARRAFRPRDVRPGRGDGVMSDGDDDERPAALTSLLGGYGYGSGSGSDDDDDDDDGRGGDDDEGPAAGPARPSAEEMRRAAAAAYGGGEDEGPAAGPARPSAEEMRRAAAAAYGEAARTFPADREEEEAEAKEEEEEDDDDDEPVAGPARPPPGAAAAAMYASYADADDDADADAGPAADPSRDDARDADPPPSPPPPRERPPRRLHSAPDAIVAKVALPPEPPGECETVMRSGDSLQTKVKRWTELKRAGVRVVDRLRCVLYTGPHTTALAW